MPPKKKNNIKIANEQENNKQKNNQSSQFKQKKEQDKVPHEQNSFKADAQAISQAEKLKQRALKFGGSLQTMSDLAKLNQFRLMKFGKLPPQTKFQKNQKPVLNSLLEEDDQRTIKARLQKFGVHNKSLLLQKKQQGISLDDQIQKSKKIYKHSKAQNISFKKDSHHKHFNSYIGHRR